MNRLITSIRWLIGGGLLAAAIGTGLYGVVATAQGVDSQRGEYERHERDSGHESSEREDDDENEGGWLSGQSDTLPGLGSTRVAASNADYQTECGGCHMVYPAGLLPSESWQALMGNLADHFGENAELLPETADKIEAYLTANAADKQRTWASARMLRNLDGAEQTVLRITELPYFKAKHHEVPARMVQDNPGVRSFSNCNACHQKAEQGVFDEDTVSIPGYGRIDD